MEKVEFRPKLNQLQSQRRKMGTLVKAKVILDGKLFKRNTRSICCNFDGVKTEYRSCVVHDDNANNDKK